MPDGRYHSYQSEVNRCDAISSGLDDRRVTRSFQVKNEDGDDDAMDEVHCASNSSVAFPNQDMFRDLLTGDVYNPLISSGVAAIESAFTRISHDYADFEKKTKTKAMCGDALTSEKDR